jgi:uncharacterized surface protein with fasciclin (FAS1) repeats
MNCSGYDLSQDAAHAIISMHIIHGQRLHLSNLTNGGNYTMMNGNESLISKFGNYLTIGTTNVSNITIECSDIAVSRGIVHEIDAVLVPKEFDAFNFCQN